jgi:hypothetical protein
MGDVKIKLYTLWISGIKGVEWSVLRYGHIIPGKEPPVLLNRRELGPKADMNQTPDVQHLTSHFTDCTIPEHTLLQKTQRIIFTKYWAVTYGSMYLN